MSGKSESGWRTASWWFQWNYGRTPKWWEWVALAVGLAIVAVAVKRLFLGE